jgi:hypothetical protein
MAEKEMVIIREVLVKEPLTQEMIDAGAELLRRLDDANFDVQAALWLYRSEVNRWRLILAFPNVETEGIAESYKKLRIIRDQIPDDYPKVDQFGIGLVRTNDRMLRALRKGRSMFKLAFPRHVWSAGGHEYYIEEAYIYRLNPS